MKAFLIVLALLSSSLAAVFFMIESPHEKVKTFHSKQQETLRESINNNLVFIRRITKEADMQQADLFKENSIRLLAKMKDYGSLGGDFILKYSRLNDIVTDTIHFMRDQPTLSNKIIKTKQETETFNKKLKSIGLAELNYNWHGAQKSYNKFSREPDKIQFKNYEHHLKLSKNIITELYLEDEDEEYLLSYLDGHYTTSISLYHVYNQVGFDRICDIKPLVYTIKNHMQLNTHTFEKQVL